MKKANIKYDGNFRIKDNMKAAAGVVFREGNFSECGLSVTDQMKREGQYNRMERKEYTKISGTRTNSR